eukprot:Gb_00385 [translate_table: standard]
MGGPPPKKMISEMSREGSSHTMTPRGTIALPLRPRAKNNKLKGREGSSLATRPKIKKEKGRSLPNTIQMSHGGSFHAMAPRGAIAWPPRPGPQMEGEEGGPSPFGEQVPEISPRGEISRPRSSEGEGPPKHKNKMVAECLSPAMEPHGAIVWPPRPTTATEKTWGPGAPNKSFLCGVVRNCLEDIVMKSSGYGVYGRLQEEMRSMNAAQSHGDGIANCPDSETRGCCQHSGGPNIVWASIGSSREDWRSSSVSHQFAQGGFSFREGYSTQVQKCKHPNIEGLSKLIQSLSELNAKANALTEGRRTNAYNCVKTIAECLPALMWVVYIGKECGLILLAVHVEESWQSTEFFNNKFLVKYKSKDNNHVEWAKARKELFVLGLRDYVRKFYPLGPT